MRVVPLARVGMASALALVGTGCLMGRQHPAATRPATELADPKSGTFDYWLNRPAVTSVRSRDFDALWNACRDAAEADGFLIDRRDYRDGLLTTMPLVSKGAYEVWRRDVTDAHELAQSTFGTIRRSIRFNIRRQPDGWFVAEPRVVVERYSVIERRITSVSEYAYAFQITQADVGRQLEQNGMRIPPEYWFCIGRDEPLERQLARSATDRLNASGEPHRAES